METVQTAFWVVALLVVLALAFDFMNGFHDAANSIATVVSTAPPGRAEAAAADFTTPEAVEHFARQMAARADGIDILVLNASIEILQDYTEITGAIFDRQIAINLRAPLILLQHLLPPMRARRWGRVVTIGSIQQLKPHPQMLVYAGTKSAQLNWVRSLARQAGPDGGGQHQAVMPARDVFEKLHVAIPLTVASVGSRGPAAVGCGSTINAHLMRSKEHAD